MPLSDHEQRLLEQMERALYQEDPKFASSLRSGRNGGADRKRVAVGSLGALAGLVVVVVGAVVAVPPLGVFGFALMVAGSYWAWSGFRSSGPNPLGAVKTGGIPGPAPAKGGTSPFMSKMEQRWRKRREGDGL